MTAATPEAVMLFLAAVADIAEREGGLLYTAGVRLGIVDGDPVFVAARRAWEAARDQMPLMQHSWCEDAAWRVSMAARARFAAQLVADGKVTV